MSTDAARYFRPVVVGVLLVGLYWWGGWFPVLVVIISVAIAGAWMLLLRWSKP